MTAFVKGLSFSKGCFLYKESFLAGNYSATNYIRRHTDNETKQANVISIETNFSHDTDKRDFNVGVGIIFSTTAIMPTKNYDASSTVRDNHHRVFKQVSGEKQKHRSVAHSLSNNNRSKIINSQNTVIGENSEGQRNGSIRQKIFSNDVIYNEELVKVKR